MKIVLTPYLLDFLIRKGYRYLLSKTQSNSKPGCAVTLEMIPVTSLPDLSDLPAEFDTYFDITEEPLQMVKGVDDTEFLVKLELSEALDFKQYLLRLCLKKLNRKPILN